MASEKILIERRDQELKHLWFVKMIALNALVCASNLYEYAKMNSGPLKYIVGAIESAVTTVVGPVYDRFKGIPVYVLVLVDNKVEEVANKIDDHTPALAKKVVSHTLSMIEKALEVAGNTIRVSKNGGPRSSIRYLANLSRQFVLTQLVAACYAINQHEYLHTVACSVVPTAAEWTVKYNDFVEDRTKKGYAIFSHLPSVPIDELGKAYRRRQAEAYIAKQGDADEVN